MRQEFARVREIISTSRYTGISENELVTTVVDVNGQLHQIDIDPRIYRRPDSEDLVKSIMQAYANARAAAANGLAETLQETLGPEFDLTAFAAGGDPSSLIKAAGRHLVTKFQLSDRTGGQA